MLFEQCDRVPLVIRAPGITEPGTSTEGLVELVDLYPTLAELCDLEKFSDLQGRSLAEMLQSPDAEGKEFTYTVVSRGDKLGKAIRTENWRYAVWPDGEELYDVKNDVEEQHNLANSGEQKTTLANLRTKLSQAESLALSARHKAHAIRSEH